MITNRNPKEWFKALEQMRMDEPPLRTASRHILNVPDGDMPELSPMQLAERTNARLTDDALGQRAPRNAQKRCQ